VGRDIAGNMSPLPAHIPQQPGAGHQERADGARELLMMRWGFSPPVIPAQDNFRGGQTSGLQLPHYWRQPGCGADRFYS
jgi:hypothetical protein